MSHRIPGFVCQIRSWYEMDDGTLVRWASPPPGLSAKTELTVTDEDKAEFKLLKGKITDPDAGAYVKHRDEFFGSRAAYAAFAIESDKELNDTKNLRKLIELKGDAQTVFYRWVRKAYHNSGVTDVPAMIKRGTSQKLADELAKVKLAYGQKFQAGGFNPRPKKSAKYQYRLGTISEHATGNAIDVESGTNPILSKSDWDFLQKFTGKKVDLTLDRWKKEPEAVWQDVKDVSDEFVKKLAAEIKRVEAEQKTAPKPTKPASTSSTPAEAVLGKHVGLQKHASGFFTLELKLVSLLHEHGFRWGATFYPGSVDLHHFELTA